MLKKIFKFIFRLQNKFYMRLMKAYYESLLKECGEGLKVYGKVNLQNPEKIKIGKNTSLNDNVYLNGMYEIEIGNDCSISANAMVISTMLKKEELIFESIKIHAGEKIKIGNFVQIGAGAIILSGVEIGDNVIVGAGSIVTKSIPNNSVAYGNPARYK